jgi:hypothetical protein
MGFPSGGEVAGALQRGDLLILDNARVHHAKVAGSIVGNMLGVAGIRLVFLPAYRYYRSPFASFTIPSQPPSTPTPNNTPPRQPLAPLLQSRAESMRARFCLRKEPHIRKHHTIILQN